MHNRDASWIIVPLNCYSLDDSGQRLDCLIGLKYQPCGHFDRVSSENCLEESSDITWLLQRAQEREETQSICQGLNDRGFYLLTESKTIYVHASPARDEPCRLMRRDRARPLTDAFVYRRYR